MLFNMFRFGREIFMKKDFISASENPCTIFVGARLEESNSSDF